MSRGIDSAVTSSISTERHVRLVTFVHLALDSGSVYVHDSIGTFTWGSQNWLGVGDLGGIGSLEENREMSSYEVTVILSGLDSTLLDVVLEQPYQGRAITIYLGALDLDTGALLATPNEIWAGVMDVARVSVGAADDNAIEITCESEFAKLDDINGRTMSDSDLQAEFNGDTLLQYLHKMSDARVVWRGDAITGIRTPGQRGDAGNPFDPSHIGRR